MTDNRNRNFIHGLRKAIVYETDKTGKIRTTKQKAVFLPILDTPRTKKNIQALLDHHRADNSSEQLLELMKSSISSMKSLYNRTHDGFRLAKGAGKDERITVGDMYAFSEAAAICFGFLKDGQKKSKHRIGIGVMSPAVQDCGKNLIRMVWQAEGHEVFDFGKNLKVRECLELILENQISILGLSIMLNACMIRLRELLKLISDNEIVISICLGGMAINRLIVNELSREFNLPLYYGQDINDAESVLDDAINGKQIKLPPIKNVQALTLPEVVFQPIANQIIQFFEFPISDVCVNQKSRNGCLVCDEDRKRSCPLETGFEKQKGLEESKQLVATFKKAILIFTDGIDFEDRIICKSLWEQLISVEQYLDKMSNSILSFRYPLICPFCRSKDCTLSKGRCMYPIYYRPVPEAYNINISETIKSIFGENVLTGVCSLILIS